MILTDPESPDESVRRLIDDEANATGGSDYITALFFRVREGEVQENEQ